MAPSCLFRTDISKPLSGHRELSRRSQCLELPRGANLPPRHSPSTPVYMKPLRAAALFNAWI
ncbi:uncharacterized protein LY79DRAFT_538559 [Colletotrichum navitas]|uniref:Uncharacterized protein n=1 Tax=Colletotrichum navitas TaxID=681940 RepID=A0AAD8QBH7_9PEZI|nr:uncharacterized protein LY79DRAFT_538559 [Colletotrichum navitas]KAK1598228.1 hypothetical protein LY79DRAFT_538559 [Colletotrichum navitas]